MKGPHRTPGQRARAGPGPRRRTGATALALGLLLACPGPGPRRQVDLAELFPAARSGAETARLDLGSDASRPYLVSGWGPRAQSGGVEFQWGQGERSELRFDVGEPRELELTLRGWPLAFAGAPPQTVAVDVNGRAVATLALEPGPHGYRVAIPGDALVRGENRLGLRYAWARAPRDVIPGAAERRPLAVAWDGLRVRDAREHGAPGVETGPRGPVLRLPLDAWVDYALRVPDGGVLRSAAVEAYGAPEGAALEVVTEPAGGPRVATRIAPGGALALPLPDAGGAPLRLSLRALGTAAAGSAAGLRLEAPALDVAGASAPAPPPRASAPPPNVVVYLVDTLRADRLGVYGFPRDTSPQLDAFAHEATVFRNATAQSSWTKPAVASLFTGLLPQTHRVNPRRAGVPESLPTLPELLRERGYATLGVVANGNVSRVFGFARGFDAFEELREGDGPEIHQLSDRVNEVALELLARRPQGRPFFLYVHSADPHWPYTPREPFRSRLAGDVHDPEAGHAPLRGGAVSDALRADVGRLYEAEIAFNDDSFGRLLENLREQGLLAQSLLVFLSDHGEAFAEHGSFRHGTTLFAEEIRIPLVIRFPGGVGAGRVVDTPARQVDVLPTILEAVGAPIPPGLAGRSLLAAATGGGPRGGEPDPALAYLNRGGRIVEAAIDGGHKLIRFRVEGRGAPSLGLFDVAADPGETRDLADAEPVWRDYLLGRLDAAAAAPAGPAPPTAQIDDEQRRALEALGYLDGE